MRPPPARGVDMGKDTGIQVNDMEDSRLHGNVDILDLKIIPERGEDGKIRSGLVIGNTLEQNKALILISNQGELKLRPQIGVGIDNAILSEEYLEFRHRIRRHFAMDGLTVRRLDLYMNKPFKVDASY